MENKAIIDSGCSCHVCGKNYERKLVNMRRGPTICIRMADGMTRESNVYRLLILKIRTDSRPRKIRLGEVLYIEEITHLLLSIGMMMSKDAEFHMAQDHMMTTVGDIHTHIMKQGSKNLYRLQIIKDDVSINMAEEDPGYTVKPRMIGFLTVSKEI